MLRSLIVLATLSATPVFATEWVNCSDGGGAASFDYLAGDGTGVLSISELTVTAGEKVWANGPASGPGDPVSIGQAFEDQYTVQIDAMDKDFAKIAELRLFKATEGDNIVYAGTLRITGMGAWAVSCEGP
jgi:hypothetical protein